MPLPIPREIDAFAALHRQMGNAVHLIAIRDALFATPLRSRFNGACPPSRAVARETTARKAG
jgi:hypothetical protein